MDAELTGCLSGQKKKLWQALLARCGLQADEGWDSTVLLWEDGELIASGSRQGNLLKCIAVEESRQGEGLTATLITHLRQDAFRNGFRHLFLYTKPQNRHQFSSLFFYPIAQTPQVLLMENERDGIRRFLNATTPVSAPGTVGAIVMNCDPFTGGHRYLIEKAAAECDHVYVFVLSEDKGHFSAADRFQMVKLGTEDLSNVTVLPTGPYLISSVTFPTYFIQDREQAKAIHCQLDVEIFCKHYAPHFGITRRYVGTEPLSPTTEQYNRILQQALPTRGIELRVIPRVSRNEQPISASHVRKALLLGDTEQISKLVPDTTYRYLLQHDLLK